MADDKSKTNNSDRKRVAADQGYEVSYFARKHGLSSKDARALIERFGNDRTRLNTEAEEMAKNSAGARRRTRTRASGASSSGTQTGSVDQPRSSRLTKAAVLSGALAAGGLLWSLRTQLRDQISKLSDQLSGSRKNSEAEEAVTGADTSGGIFSFAREPRSSSRGRSQVEIAEEALTLKETGALT